MTKEEIEKELEFFCKENGYGDWTWMDYEEAVIKFCEHFYVLGEKSKSRIKK